MASATITKITLADPRVVEQPSFVVHARVSRIGWHVSGAGHESSAPHGTVQTAASRSHSIDRQAESSWHEAPAMPGVPPAYAHRSAVHASSGASQSAALSQLALQKCPRSSPAHTRDSQS